MTNSPDTRVYPEGATTGMHRATTARQVDHDQEAEQLLQRRWDLDKLAARNAALAERDVLCSDDLTEWLNANAALEDACKEFRRRFYPCLHLVIVALDMVGAYGSTEGAGQIVYPSQGGAVRTEESR